MTPDEIKGLHLDDVDNYQSVSTSGRTFRAGPSTTKSGTK